MAGEISTLPLGTAPADADLMEAVDTSDTTEAASGTNKRWPLSTLKTYFQTGIAGSGGGGACFVVASSTAHATIKARADYVCDGTADQTEINTALALGSVQLTDGDYILSAPITVNKPGHSLRGMGQGHDQGANGGRGFGTIIKGATTFSGAALIVVDQTGTFIVGKVNIRDIGLDGTGIVSSTVDGIRIKSFQGTVENMFAESMPRNGFVVEGNDVGDAAWDSYDLRLARLEAARCGGAGLYMDRASADVHCVECVFLYNSGPGIDYNGGGSSGQFTGIHCYSNLMGVRFKNSAGTRCKFVNCKIEHSQQHGVMFDGSAGTGNASWTQWVGCGFNCNGESANNTYDHINITGTSAPSKTCFVNCHFGNSDGAVNLARYAVNLSFYGSGALIIGCYFGGEVGTLANAGVATGLLNIGNATVRNSITLIGNVGVDDWRGTGAAVTAAAGANAGTTPPAPVIVAESVDQCGKITFGTGTTPAAGAMVVVTYNRAKNPGNHRVMITAANAATAALLPYLNASSTTSFTVGFANAPAASQANTFYAFEYFVGP